MANISEFIQKAVLASAGNVSIPSNVKDQVLGGLSQSVLGSLTQTATKAGGIDQIKNLLSGRTAAAESPITSLAGNLFKKNVLGNLNLGSALNSSLSGVIPAVMGKLGGIIKDVDGDGDVDFQDIILSLKGGNAAAKPSAGSGILGAATSILGGLFKK